MANRVESPSSINTFRQCKRKYYYQYIAKLPTLPNIHQVRGNIAHSALELFYDIDTAALTAENSQQKLTAAIQALFVQTWGNYQPKLAGLGLSKDQERFYFEETMLMLMNWVNQFTPELKQAAERKNLSLSEAFEYLKPLREQEFKSDRYSIRGFIDAIRQLEDEVHIIDYKTNANFDMKDELKIQLAIYSLLYFEKHGKMPSKVGIFFLRHKLKLIDVDDVLLDMAKREIQLIHAHTSKGENMDDYPRCVGPLCKWSTGKCDFYDTCKPHEMGVNGLQRIG